MTAFTQLYDARRFLEGNGFCEYHDPFASDGIVASYQKKYRDKRGVKYFVEAHVWHFPNMDADPYVLEYGGQYYAAGTHDAINMTFISWDIEQVETWLNGLFDAGALEHYERDES